MATILGTAGADTVTAAISVPGQPLPTAGGDSIFGNAGRDLLHGLDGADTIEGGSGADTLLGGDGNDRFILRGEVLGDGDSIDGGLGRDLLDFTGWSTFPVLRLDLTAGTLVGSPGPGPLFVFATFVAASIEEAIGSGFDDRLTGDGDANRFEGRAGADTLRGEAAGDSLYGDDGDDLLEGGAGNDLLVAGTGADTVLGGDGIDTANFDFGGGVSLVLTEAETTIGSGPSGDYAFGGIENLIGSRHADTLIAEQAGPNLLFGEDGADRLTGGSGDTLEGGGGNDIYRLAAADAVTRETAQSGGHDRVESPFDHGLTTFIEDLLLTGTARYGGGNGLANVITGNAASNLLDGLDGADTLDGAGGTDILLGGAGDDLYFVDDPGDLVADSDGLGEIRANVSYTLPGSITRLDLEGAAGLRGAGTLGHDLIRSTGGGDTLIGADGDDTLDGEDGGDLMTGGAGNDLFLFGDGADTLDGGLGDDSYAVGAGDVVLPDAGGFDVINATVSFRLPTRIESLFLSGDEATRMDGTGSGLANNVVGSGGANRLAGGGGEDTLVGDRGEDTLLGGEGADTLLGGGDGDVLLGGAGNDLLAGDQGADRLRGDAGADLFRLGAEAFLAGTADSLLDFDAAEGDRIAIEAGRLPGALLPEGPLDPSLFAANLSGRLAIAGPSFVYETDAGRLWFDDDWSGGPDRMLIAALIGKPALAAADMALF